MKKNEALQRSINPLRDIIGAYNYLKALANRKASGYGLYQYNFS